MASRLLSLTSNVLVKQAPSKFVPCAYIHGKSRIGNREVVGFGVNGSFVYADILDYPMPAIRYKETTPEITALKEKEKGDWKKLSMEEKKALYRASFCQTYTEMKAPTGEWKSIMAGVLTMVSAALWFFMYLKSVYPEQNTRPYLRPENQERVLRTFLALEAEPIQGLSSKWDYEKGNWKK